MDHVSDNRSRPDNRNLNNNVVKALWPHPWQTRHLGAALDLEHADGIGLLQRGINVGITRGKVSEIDFIAIVIANQFQRILENGHHSEPQQVHFDDAHVRAIVLVPLHDCAAGHCRPLEWNNRIELPLTNHHAARVLAKMARQVLKAQT